MIQEAIFLPGVLILPGMESQTLIVYIASMKMEMIFAIFADVSCLTAVRVTHVPVMSR